MRIVLAAGLQPQFENHIQAPGQASRSKKAQNMELCFKRDDELGGIVWEKEAFFSPAMGLVRVILEGICRQSAA